MPFLVLPGRQKEHTAGSVPDALRERLWKGLLASETVIVVGYSFRDSYLTEIFARALAENEELELLVIDPQAQAIVDSAFSTAPNGRVHALACEFGGPEFGAEIVDALREGLGYAPVVPPSVEPVRPGGRPVVPVHWNARPADDPDSLAGSVVEVPEPQQPPHPAAVVFGPYARLDAEGRYRAYFRVKAEGCAELPSQGPAFDLDVAARRARDPADAAAHRVESRSVLGYELQQGHFQVFTLDFDWKPTVWLSGSLELRLLVPPGDRVPEGWRLSRLVIDTRWVRRLGPVPRMKWVFRGRRRPVDSTDGPAAVT